MILLHKPLGETPLETLDRLRLEKLELADLPMTYAGRLDPMAEGLLIVLVGEETKEKDKYTNLDKEYEFEVLFGFQTDTADLLGKVVQRDVPLPVECKDVPLPYIQDYLKKLVGKHSQVYPNYSSKTVNGKPLWLWAREGKTDEIEIPTKEIEVYSLDLINMREISGAELLKNIEEKISKIKGDFRQQEILDLWRKNLFSCLTTYYLLLTTRVRCSSGTYIRSIVERLGELVGVPTVAYSIKRTRIGEYQI